MTKLKREKKVKGLPADRQVDPRLARALADYDNLVKRFEAQRQEITLRGTRDFILELLPVVDDLFLAQAHLKDQGLQITIDHLNKVLADHGVSEIKVAAGDKFDSKIHEALETVSGGQQDKVAKVLARGYRWNDGMVLRPAKVAVYGEEPKKEEQLDQEMIRGDYP